MIPRINGVIRAIRIWLWWRSLPWWFRRHLKFSELGEDCCCGVPTMKCNMGGWTRWRCIGKPGIITCGYSRDEANQ